MQQTAHSEVSNHVTVWNLYTCTKRYEYMLDMLCILAVQDVCETNSKNTEFI